MAELVLSFAGARNLAASVVQESTQTNSIRRWQPIMTCAASRGTRVHSPGRACLEPVDEVENWFRTTFRRRSYG